MVQTPIRPLSLEQFLQLPETKPASEFIKGQIIQKPMPQGKHSTLQGDLVPAVNTVLKPDRIARAYPELRCTFGGRSIVPDVAIAPDWTIEILSPDQNQTKVVRNILHCLAHGTQMGWLIDPDEELVFVYFPDRTIAIFEDRRDRLPVPPFAESFSLTLDRLFSWLEE
jgi:Uma2 family endonuclease